MRPLEDAVRTWAQNGFTGRPEYKTIYETDVILFIKERSLPAYDGTGPGAKQIKQWLFLCEDSIWSMTSQQANTLEEVV